MTEPAALKDGADDAEETGPDLSTEPLRDLPREMLTFGIIGVAGLVVDWAILHFAMYAFNLGLISGRVVSYFFAATFTWWANRTFTFRMRGLSGIVREWAQFLVANAAGGLVNFAVYSVLVHVNATARAWPILALAAGSLTGMVFNFVASKWVVFTRRP